MTALRNVAFPLRQLRIGGHDARRRAAEMLERVGLGHLGERYPNELSGGEQQRVALARALVGGVGLLLFDEPLSNLDADMREQLRLAISTLARDSGATSVYITHDQSEAFSLADRVGVRNCSPSSERWNVLVIDRRYRCARGGLSSHPPGKVAASAERCFSS
jgi:iron(III) transport system ATP-binding protein